MKLSIIFIICFFVSVIFSNFAFSQGFEQKYLCEGKDSIGFKFLNNSWERVSFNKRKYIVTVINLGQSFEVKYIGDEHAHCSSRGDIPSSGILYCQLEDSYDKRNPPLVYSYFKFDLSTFEFLSGNIEFGKNVTPVLQIGKCTAI